MQSSRQLNVLWGVVFVGIAAFVLLNALGNIPEGLYDIFVRVLPAVLIFAGLSIILPSRVPLGTILALIITVLVTAGVALTAFSNQSGQFQDGQQQIIDQTISDSVTLLQINIQTLDTDVEIRVSDTARTISGEFVGSVESDLTLDYAEDAEGRGTFTFSETPLRDFPILENIGRGRLELLIPADLPLALAFDGDTGNTLLDMSTISLERLNVSSADGNIGVTLPEYMPLSPNAAEQPGNIIAENGDVTVFVPDSVSVRFELNRQGSGIDPQFDDIRYLYLVGDVLEARDYADAELSLRYIITAPSGQIAIESLP